MDSINVKKRMTSIKKFYFIEYFYIALKSIEMYQTENDTFNFFRKLKDKYQLGESKYKKLTIVNEEDKSDAQIKRYKYTYKQIIAELETYSLISRYSENEIFILEEKGKELIEYWEAGNQNAFFDNVFGLIEERINGYNLLINKFYEINKEKGGLLIFPVYSPLKLGFEKNQFKKMNVFFEYTKKLYLKLEHDVEMNFSKRVELHNKNIDLLNKLKVEGLISSDKQSDFNLENYNKIVKRVRDWWLKVFLNDIYKLDMSFSNFDIWVHRGKQFGIINTTEFFPSFDGRVVYPTSIISKKISNKDFELFYEYSSGEKLYIHRPNWKGKFKDIFTDKLYNSYHDLRTYSKSIFINLTDLKDIVCYKLRIPNQAFALYLEKSYKMSLEGELKYKISLEADKLPEETNAMYLKREPINIDGTLKNIISIQLKR